MNRLVLSLGALLLCSFSFAQNRNDYSLLWRFKLPEAKSYSYLLGTMHMNDNRVFDFSDSVLVCFDRCQGAAFEFNMDSLNYITAQIMSKEMNMGDMLFGKQTTKEDDFSEEKLNFDPKDFLRREAIRRQKVKKNNPDQKDFLDSYLYKRASAKGKTVIGLEVSEGYLQRSMPNYSKFKDLDTVAVEEAMEEILTNRITEEDMLNIYWRGDLDSLTSIMYHPRMNAITSELNLVKRNYMHFYGIKNFNPDSTYFVSVGAGHLGGEEGIIRLLEKDGYIVEKVEPSFKGTSEHLKKEKFEMPWKRFDHEDGVSFLFPTPPAEVDFEGNAMMDMYISMDTENEAGWFLGALKLKLGNYSITAMEESIRENLRQDLNMSLDKVRITEMKDQEAIEIIGSYGQFGMRAFYIFHSSGKMYYAGGFARDKKTLEGSAGDRFFQSVEYHEAKNANPESWKEFIPKNSNFSIQAPALITERVIEETQWTDLPSEKIYLNMYMDAGLGKAYIFRHSDCLPSDFYSDEEETLKSLGEFFGKQGGKTILLDSTGRFMNYPAYFSHVKTEDVYLQLVMFLRGTRSYLVVISQGEDELSWSDPFLTGFSVLPYVTEERTMKTKTDLNAEIYTFAKGTEREYTTSEMWAYTFPTDSTAAHWNRDDKSSIQQGFIRFDLDSLYSRSNLDSVLFDMSKGYNDFFGDSIVTRTYLDEEGYRVLKYESVYPKFPMLKKKGKILLNGREVICSVVAYPHDYTEMSIVDSLAYSFRPLRKNEYDITSSKAKEIIARIKKKDEEDPYDYLIYQNLQKYHFEKEDLPILHEAFLHNYVSDTAIYYGYSRAWADVLLKLNDPDFTKFLEQKVRNQSSQRTKEQLWDLYVDADSSAAGLEHFLDVIYDLDFKQESNILHSAFLGKKHLARLQWEKIRQLGRQENFASGYLQLIHDISSDTSMVDLLPSLEQEFPSLIQSCVKSYRRSIREGVEYPLSYFTLRNSAAVAGEFKRSDELLTALDSIRVVVERTESCHELLTAEMRLGSVPDKKRISKCLKSVWDGFPLIVDASKYGLEKVSGIEKLKDEEVLISYYKYSMSEDYELNDVRLYKKIVTSHGTFYVLSYRYDEEKETFYDAFGPFTDKKVIEYGDDLYRESIDNSYGEDYSKSAIELRDTLIKSIKEGTYTRFWDTYEPGSTY